MKVKERVLQFVRRIVGRNRMVSIEVLHYRSGPLPTKCPTIHQFELRATLNRTSPYSRLLRECYLVLGRGRRTRARCSCATRSGACTGTPRTHGERTGFGDVEGLCSRHVW